MKRTIIPLLLVLLISFGCTSSDTTKIIKNESNTSSNLTNITIQKIQIPINETPKIVEGNGTNGTAKDALKLAKETILPYSDNFILWLKGENINEQGIPKKKVSGASF